MFSSSARPKNGVCFIIFGVNVFIERNVKLLLSTRFFPELRLPGGFEINGVGQHQAGIGRDGIWTDQVLDSLSCLI